MTTNPHSLGICNHILENYFTKFNGDNRLDLLQFYSPDGSIFWDGTEYTGNKEINDLFSSLPQLQFHIAGYDVQSVMATHWTMIVFYGSIDIQGKGIYDFHMSFYVDADEENQKAFIKYQTFQSF